ncbi:MAG TPA: aminoglycoside phosphotransferase family protein, partial [Isosphaeraceae bacterium]|nr:aminoglycoside phosphotransferase family protein [Isosphaeraceae bacterium]
MIDDLNAILTQYPPTARPSSPPELLGNAGGLSGARLWRFVSGQGRLVARCWPPEWPDRAALEQIHRWLAEAGRIGFVPVPLANRSGRTFVEHAGRFWELAHWMPGQADLQQPPALNRLHAGFTGLAAFHQSLAHHQTAGASPGLARRLRELETWLGGGFDELDRVLRKTPTDAGVDLARRWLRKAHPLAPRLAEEVRLACALIVPNQPCLRDVRPDHLLFEGDQLTGLVDFGAMATDSVAGDMAR